MRIGKQNDVPAGGISAGAIAAQEPLFSLKQLARLFDVQDLNGQPATETICEWWHSGRLPPPDIKISRKAIYWKKATIDDFINRGGLR